jgi:hypothetical protein
MAGVREILLYGFSAMIVLVVAKLAAPTIQKIPLVGEPVANLFVFA